MGNGINIVAAVNTVRVVRRPVLGLGFGCSTLLWGGHTLDSALAGIRQAGFDAIELCSIPGMGADHLPADASPEIVSLIGRSINDRGLAIDSIGASSNLADPDARKRVKRLMGLAADLGAPSVASSPGGVSDDEASFSEAVRWIDELAQHGGDLGVRLALKPHLGSVAYSANTALRLMNEVDTEWVCLNFDASHVYRAGDDAVESLRDLAPHVGNARIRDAKSSTESPPPVAEQVCGAGVLDIHALVEVMRGIDRLQYVVLEIVGMNGYPLEVVQELAEESIKHLQAA